jgi:hypothetical protein
VLRSSVLLVLVLSLALGSSANLICLAWCDARESTATNCHRETSDSSAASGVPSSSPALTRDNCCSTATLGIVALVAEKKTRAAASSVSPHALVLKYQFSLPHADARVDGPPTPHLSPQKRLVAGVLRV